MEVFDKMYLFIILICIVKNSIDFGWQQQFFKKVHRPFLHWYNFTEKIVTMRFFFFNVCTSLVNKLWTHINFLRRFTLIK